MQFSFWKEDYRLDEMTLPDLWKAFLLYKDIHIYFALAIAAIGTSLYLGITGLQSVAIGATVFIIYPMVWYGLHRWVLHGRLLYKIPATAKVWKRIHFDHHRDPYDLKILFGALYTTLPTLVIATAPFGYLLGGLAGIPLAFSFGVIMTIGYEFFHCIQHLNYEPKFKFIKKMKRLHLLHHFFDENSNYGITSFWPDQVFSSFKPSAKEIGAKSPTVFNLGYTGTEVEKYPWVAELTPDINIAEAVQNGVQLKKPTRKLAS